MSRGQALVTVEYKRVAVSISLLLVRNCFMPFLDLVLDLPLDTRGWSTLEIVTYLALQVPRVINISFLLTISMYSWGERSPGSIK